MMDLKVKFLLLILITVNISCKNQPKENEVPNAGQNEILKENNQVTKMENTKIDEIKIIEQLQAKWKENEYPYRTVEFVGSTVKFVEEGTESKPKFEKFEIAGNCPFENNNIRDVKSSDIILSLPESNRCEKLKVSNDTLFLSGFSTNTNGDYIITYLKLE